MFCKYFVPVALVLSYGIYSSTAFAESCASEEALAIQEDLENATTLAEELGFNTSSSEGEEMIESLMASSCNNTQPTTVTIYIYGVPISITYCPAPSIPCSKGKQCRPRSDKHGCSCQEIKKTKEGDSNSGEM